MSRNPLRFLLSLLLVVLAFGLPFQATAQTTPNAWINELHYDNDGGDTGEFVEIIVEDAGSYTKSDFEMVLYRDNGTSYDSETLDNFSVGAPGGNFSTFSFDFTADGGSIQNGPGDGLALCYTGAPVQVLSYEGTFTSSDICGSGNAATSTDIGVSEDGSTPAGQSLQLTGTGGQYSDFSWSGPSDDSPGSVNDSQTLSSNAVITVDDDGGADYTSIQDAIDAANAGDVIQVGDGNYVENVTVDKELSLEGSNAGVPGASGSRGVEATVEGQVVVVASGVVIDGFDISPPPATSNATGEALRISGSTDNVVVKNNVVRDFEEDGVPSWESIEGIVAFGGSEHDAIENLTVSDNLVQNIQGRSTEGGAVGISIQGNVEGAAVSGNVVSAVGMQATTWAFGIVVRGTDNHSEDPANVDILNNELSSILSDPATSTMGVGFGFEDDPGATTVEDNVFSNTELQVEDKAGSLDLDNLLANNTFDRAVVVRQNPISVPIIFSSIQDAIDAASSGETVDVLAGTYNGTINIDSLNDLTISGASKSTVTIEPDTTLPWNVGGYGALRQTATRVVDATNVTLENMTFDFDQVAASQMAGVLFWNATGTVTNNVLKNNQVDDASGGQHELGAYIRATKYSPSSRAAVTLSDNEFVDLGRVAVNLNDFVDATISNNEFYKTEDDAGYGIEVASEASATVTGNTIYGFDKTFTDSSRSGGIYVHNSFTNDQSAGFVKNVTVSENEVYDNQVGVQFGNGWDGLGGPVQIAADFSNNDIHDNAEVGVIIRDEDKENGSSVSVTAIGNSVKDNGGSGYHIHTEGDGDLTVDLSSETITGNSTGLKLGDLPDSSTTSNYDISVQQSTVKGANGGNGVFFTSHFNGSVDVNHNLIKDFDRGVSIDSGVDLSEKDVGINSNCIVENNNYGIAHEGTGTLDAIDNWWGSASGPSETDVMGDVDVTPYDTEPVADVEGCGGSGGECIAETKPFWDGNFQTDTTTHTGSFSLETQNGFSSIQVLTGDSDNIALTEIRDENGNVISDTTRSGRLDGSVRDGWTTISYTGSQELSSVEAVVTPLEEDDSRFMFSVQDETGCALQVDPQVTLATPSDYALKSSFPNPFHEATTIRFKTPEAADVRLDVFDALGRKVQTLVSKQVKAGTHEVTWNGTDAAGTRLASGVYFYRLRAGSFTKTERVVLAR